MEAGLVEEALALLRRAAQGVAAAVLACSPPHSPGRVTEMRSSGRAAGRGHGRAKVKAASRAAFKAAGFKRRAGASPRAQKGGAGLAQAHSMKRKGRGGPIKTIGLGLPREVGGSALAKGQQVSSSEEESWRGVLRMQRRKASDGSQLGRRKAEERPPSLTAGEESAGVRRVSVVVEAT
ncbi:hypothetical protein NDU88_005688 [Pleurodeles waltl]|uniref:Uncharacterized protein n=1 Tax=Pleurodeles waltl TaxID=8319 RepID=A0AAV7TBQ4_PLEWA|nr:hypothetical protein NDU88_005688 [Pleurodeles waltl]